MTRFSRAATLFTMSTVDEIKAAAMKLAASEKLDLYRWLDDSAEVRAMRLEELRREIQKGVDSLEREDFALHEDNSLDALAAEVKQRGRQRLNENRRA
jgi:antitoxin ParD1/3/4